MVQHSARIHHGYPWLHFSSHCLIALMLAAGFCGSIRTPVASLHAGETIPAAVQKAVDQSTAIVAVTRATVTQSGPGVTVAPSQVLTAFSLIQTAPIAPENDGKINALALTGLTLTVRAASPEAKPLAAKLIWFSAADNLAVVKVEGATGTPLRLESKAASKEQDTVYTLARTAPHAPATLALGMLMAGPEPGQLVLDYGVSQCADGAPVFNERGQWIGLVFPCAVHSLLAEPARLAPIFYGSIRKIQTEPADFDTTAGGPLKIQVEVSAALAAPRSVTVQIGSSTPAPAARPITLRLNPKTGLHEGTLTVPTAPGVVDLPVDETKLPNTIKLHYRMDPNCQAARNNDATANTMFEGDFYNKFIEITTPERRLVKIYFSALQHATFTTDGSASVLTTDRRTIKGHLETRFSYSMGIIKGSCGPEQIVYIEVPDAKAVDSQASLTLKFAGVGADGTPLTPTETTLK